MLPPACSIFERAEADTVTPLTLNLRCTSPMPSSLMGRSGRRTSPAPNSVSGVTSTPSASWPRCRTFTTCAGCLNGFVKPRFGMRRMSGIWPPSNPGRTLPPWRAVWPLPPRPAVLPMPEPGPRPLRMRARCEPTGAFRSCSASRENWVSGLGARDVARDLGLARGFRVALGFGFGILLLSSPWRGPGASVRRHLHEVAHLLEHAAQRGMIRVHDHILVMLEAQGLERPLHARGMTVPRAHLLDPQLPFPHGWQDAVAG